MPGTVPLKTSPRNGFLQVEYPDPHIARRREILARHPEIRELFGPNPVSALLVIALVVGHFSIAMALHMPRSGGSWSPPTWLGRISPPLSTQ